MRPIRLAAPLAILAPVALLAACGGPANDIVVTNTDQVVLNDLQSNTAFRNDNEQPANDADAMANGATADNVASEEPRAHL